MPKMSADYLLNKRNRILDAAYEVCMSKPMHEVSMRDVITQSGLSQGGIYLYFKNLDEILIALINRNSVKYELEKLTDEVLLTDQTPEKVVRELFMLWHKAVLTNLIGVGKIYYEMGVIYVNDKERLNYFTANIEFAAGENYMWEKLYQYIGKKVAAGYFKPIIAIADLAKLHITVFDGITRDLILSCHYQVASPLPEELGSLEGENLVKNFCTAFILLLNGDVTLIDA